MSKYIVKSCPNLATSYYAEGDIIHNQCGLTDDDSLCQDCTDCVMKQIVELCRKAPILDADWILNKMDIQEAE